MQQFLNLVNLFYKAALLSFRRKLEGQQVHRGAPTFRKKYKNDNMLTSLIRLTIQIFCHDYNSKEKVKILTFLLREAVKKNQWPGQ